ncbi:MAG: molybdenum cofactor guanylyltransferase [Syntrophomonadaceae bacterium]
MHKIKTSGVILAGGKSTRMKFNKAFADINGMPVIQIIINKLQKVADEILIISNKPELFAGFGLEVYPDIYPYCGPVSGIHSGLTHASYDAIFVIGCDVPFIDIELVRYLRNKINGFDCVVPEIGGRLQPTSAFYHKSCRPVFEDALKQQKLKLTWLLSELKMVVVKQEELQQFGNVNNIFLNVNSRDMLEKARELAGGLL